MHKKILIPVALDHAPLVSRKIDAARHMLAPGGTITLLTVLEQIGGFVAEFVTVKPENHLSARVLEKLRQAAGDAADIDCKVISGKPGVQITKYAKDAGVDMIIVGSHSPGQEDYHLGSTASRVVRRAHCSVYVLR